MIISHFHDKLLVGFAHKIRFRGEKQNIEQSPNATLKYCQACIPEMSIGLHGTRRGSLEKHEAAIQFIQLLLSVKDMRRGVKF